MTKTGHSFTGWSTSPTGIGQTTATTTEDVTLYAIWELNVIPYSYNRGIANGTTLTGSHVARFPNPSSFNSSYGANVTLANVGSATGDISETATVSGSSAVLQYSAPVVTYQYVSGTYATVYHYYNILNITL